MITVFADVCGYALMFAGISLVWLLLCTSAMWVSFSFLRLCLCLDELHEFICLFSLLCSVSFVLLIFKLFCLGFMDPLSAIHLKGWVPVYPDSNQLCRRQ